jgi:hypothetical protein
MTNPADTSTETTAQHRIDEAQEVPLVQEYRLRRWARKHYVPHEQRQTRTWHPIVLDEMAKRDDELYDAGQHASRIAQRYVPLEPTIRYS